MPPEKLKTFKFSTKENADYPFKPLIAISKQNKKLKLKNSENNSYNNTNLILT